MKRFIAIFVLIALGTFNVSAEWANSHIVEQSPYESRTWESINNRYDVTFNWGSFKGYISPPGFSWRNPALNVIGLFSQEETWEQYKILHAYYFVYSQSQERWMLLQNEPTEVHALYYTQDTGYALVMMDYIEYGAPFNSNVNRNNGHVTAVSNYRRNDGSVFTVSYRSLFQVDSGTFVTRTVQ